MLFNLLKQCLCACVCVYIYFTNRAAECLSGSMLGTYLPHKQSPKRLQYRSGNVSALKHSMESLRHFLIKFFTLLHYELQIYVAVKSNWTVVSKELLVVNYVFRCLKCHTVA